jgi:hypothetical protein
MFDAYLSSEVQNYINQNRQGFFDATNRRQTESKTKIAHLV